MSAVGSGFLGIGLTLTILGGLGLLGYIPFPTIGPPPQQSGLCFQSVVQSTVCAPNQSYLDSIVFAGTHTLTSSNPMYVSQTSGIVTVYGFLATGATVSSQQIFYYTPGSSPTALTITTSGVSAQGVYSFSAQTPVMSLGIQYTYQATITDSFGTKSSVTGSVIPSVSTVSFIATLQTLNGTKTIGGLPIPANTVTAANIWNTEAGTFCLTINSFYSQVKSVFLSVVDNSGAVVSNNQMNLGGCGGYQSLVQFALGSYTVTGTINLVGGTQQTAFSVRVTSIPQPRTTLTTYASTCSTATQTVNGIVYVCSIPTTTTYSITVSQTGSTCTPINGAVICVSTTTQFTCVGSVCTATSISGSSTMITTSTQSTTNVCSSSKVCGSTFSFSLSALITTIAGAVMIPVGAVLSRKPAGETS